MLSMHLTFVNELAACITEYGFVCNRVAHCDSPKACLLIVFIGISSYGSNTAKFGICLVTWFMGEGVCLSFFSLFLWKTWGQSLGV